MTTPSPRSGSGTDATQADEDHALLIAALGHSWAWYDARISRGLVVVNYFLVAMAVLATAYVSAINAELNAVAAVIGLSGVVLAAISFTTGLHQRHLATAGEKCLADLQDRIATKLGIETFRMINTHRIAQQSIPRYAPSVVAFGTAAALSLASVIYALFR